MNLEKKNRTYRDYADAKLMFWRKCVDELCLQDTDTVIIFGCGMWGKALYEQMDKVFNIKVAGFADNNRGMCGRKIDGCQVYLPDECVKKFPEAIYIIAIEGFFNEIYQQLVLLGINKEQVRRLNIYHLEKITKDYFDERLNKQYYIDEGVPFEGFIPVIKSCCKEDRRDFRVYLKGDLEKTLDKGIDPFAEQIMDQYEEFYGEYNNTDCISIHGAGTSKVKILIVCSHKDLAELSSDNEKYYVPIQGGRALTDIQLYDVCDNTGDNISDRNYNYCECTALYWAWKNKFAQDADYVGLRHYRRKFDISSEQLEHLKENGIDIVHLDPIYHDNIKNSFVHHTKNIKDWELMKSVIKDKFPEIYDTLLMYENQHFICAYNMSIMRRDLFDEYCEFLFGVLMEIEDYYLKEYDRRDRYLGYLGENLTSIFIMHVKDRAKSVIAKLIPIIASK